MLSPEQLSAFEAKLNSGSDSEAERQEEQSPTQETTTTPAPPAKEETEEKGRIPYSRFAEVNRARKEAENRAEQLARELEVLRSNKTEPAATKSFLDELAELEAPNQSAYEQRLANLEGQLIQKEAAAQLDSLIATAKQHYPDVPEKYFYAAIGAGKEIEDGAQMWEEIKREVLGTTQNTVAPTTRRTATATPPIPSRAAPTGPRKPSTMEEAHAAFRKRLMQG